MPNIYGDDNATDAPVNMNASVAGEFPARKSDARASELASDAPSAKNYRRLLEESNLPIELAVEIADALDAAQTRRKNDH